MTMRIVATVRYPDGCPPEDLALWVSTRGSPLRHDQCHYRSLTSSWWVSSLWVSSSPSMGVLVAFSSPSDRCFLWVPSFFLWVSPWPSSDVLVALSLPFVGVLVALPSLPFVGVLVALPAALLPLLPGSVGVPAALVGVLVALLWVSPLRSLATCGPFAKNPRMPWSRPDNEVRVRLAGGFSFLRAVRSNAKAVR